MISFFTVISASFISALDVTGKCELGIIKSECARHNGHVLLVSLSSSFEGNGAFVDDRQSRMHSRQKT